MGRYYTIVYLSTYFRKKYQQPFRSAVFFQCHFCSFFRLLSQWVTGGASAESTAITLEKTPANKVVSDEEWKVLWITYYENKSLPKKVPTLAWLLQTIAKVGGWCDSKRTGVPGWLVVWEGWAKLQDRLHTCRMTRGVEI